MISSIYKIVNIKADKINRNNVPVFRGLNKDTFIRSKGNIKMPDDTYKQVDKTLNLEDIKSKYSNKITILPLIMDRVMSSVERYLDGKTEANEFSKQFLDDASSLANRIALGNDSDEYCENYKPELSLIKALSPLCSGYIDNEVKKEALDSGIEEQVVKYVKNETVRERYFIQ